MDESESVAQPTPGTSSGTDSATIPPVLTEPLKYAGSFSMKLSLESHGNGATTAAQAWCVDPMVHSMQLRGCLVLSVQEV